MRAKRGLIASIILVVLGAAIHAGGWAIATVRDVPEFAVAGTPLTLTFMVRAHGMTPVDDLMPAVVATSGRDSVKTTAVATKKTGEYTATLTLPRAGKWTVELGSYGGKSTLQPLTVIAQGQPSPRPLSPAALGERLFVAKGCAACHVNRDVQTRIESVEAGPDLTGRRFPETRLTLVLTDPQAAFAGSRNAEQWVEMPNLELKKFEIAALVAFMTQK